MKTLVWLALLALSAPAHALDANKLDAAAKAQQAALAGRLGAAVLDTATGQFWGFRADERFPMDSTHKAFACAALLARVDKGEASLDTHVTIKPADLLAYSPLTQELLTPKSPTLGDMCAAALAVSDNTAANVVLNALGGPPAVTQFLRGLGDNVSRLDRNEPSLNDFTPGDVRDTTTPAAAVADLRKLILGATLSPASREKLSGWMEADRVAGPLLRDALPLSWRVADKTGSGGHGSRGIVAAIWPPERAPLVVAIYVTETPADLEARDAAIAGMGAAIREALTP